MTLAIRIHWCLTHLGQTTVLQHGLKMQMRRGKYGKYVAMTLYIWRDEAKASKIEAETCVRAAVAGISAWDPPDGMEEGEQGWAISWYINKNQPRHEKVAQEKLL